MNETRVQCIATLRETPDRLTQLTSGLADGALDYRSQPDEWTIREIMAHLVDDEMFVMRTRLERIAKEDHPSLAPNDEKAWYTTRNTSRDELVELLADFAAQRAASMSIITFLTEDDWARQGLQPEYGHFTAEKWLSYWADHDVTHIQQIERIRMATERL
jgi:hypothetical protein